MEYKKVKISDVATIIPGYAFKSKDFSKDGTKVIKITDIRPPIVDFKNCCKVDLNHYKVDKLQKYEVEKGDFIIAMTGATIGKIGRVTSDEKAYLNQRTAKFEVTDKINKDFLYYSLMRKEFMQFLMNHIDSESAQPNISANSISQYEFFLPEITEQNKIVKILLAIDKKIQINNQINDNLQNIILTMFKEFIKKNADAEEITLEDCVQKVGTGADAIQKAPIVEYDTGIRCIRVGDMTNSRTRYEWGFAEMTKKNFENYKLEVGDIVITRTAVNGISYMIEDDMKVVCNNGLIRLKVNEKYNPLYIYLCMKTKDFYDYIHRIDSETSVRPNMKVEYLTSYKIKKLSLEEQNKLCEKMTPFRKKQQEIISENNTLKQLRDSLLPKLMKGEVDLSKIEI